MSDDQMQAVREKYPALVALAAAVIAREGMTLDVEQAAALAGEVWGALDEQERRIAAAEAHMESAMRILRLLGAILSANLDRG